ncbi:NAD-P-binding protein [Thelonectria olida]|uniref:NAD-P-binding protein n=1 Tax=Thelonectria olida TaxID=1576542 RepID=A0A9P9AVB6_9HYPO|nr:NAD-P-binding protein [Thelonectria olida]
MAENNLERPCRTYLFGHPLHQSLAPLLHSTIFNSLGVPWTYEPVDSIDKDGFLPKLRADDFVGTAVTMPHKITWMEECDEITEEGRAVGAINTVFIRKDPDTGERKYIGTNTDCVGVREAFLNNYPDILSHTRGKPGLVIGGGGAARSAIYALYKWLGTSEVYLVNRIEEEVKDIISSFAQAEGKPKLVHVATVEQAQQLEARTVIVGTVPNFPPSTEEEVLARNISLEFLKKDKKGYVLEMCYHPKIVTEFYTLAEQANWNVLPGTEAMIYQGIAQEVLWMEKPLAEMPFKAARRAITDALSKRHGAEINRK